MQTLVQAVGLVVILAIGLSGFFHWPWWVVIIAALIGILWYELITGGRIGWSIRASAVLGSLWYTAQIIFLYGGVWLLGYFASFLIKA